MPNKFILLTFSTYMIQQKQNKDILDFVGNKAKGRRRQSTQNFPKNEHFLPRDMPFYLINDDLLD